MVLGGVIVTGNLAASSARKMKRREERSAQLRFSGATEVCGVAHQIEPAISTLSGGGTTYIGGKRGLRGKGWEGERAECSAAHEEAGGYVRLGSIYLSEPC